MGYNRVDGAAKDPFTGTVLVVRVRKADSLICGLSAGRRWRLGRPPLGRHGPSLNLVSFVFASQAERIGGLEARTTRQSEETTSEPYHWD